MAKLGTPVTFGVNTHGTNGKENADALPTWEVRHKTTGVVLASGTMVQDVDATLTPIVARYHGVCTPTLASGFVAGSIYDVYATATVGGVEDQTIALSFLATTYSIDDIGASTSQIGTVTGELNAPITNGSLLTLYKNGDYKLADNRAIRVTLPAGVFPDITGATCRLGVTRSKDNTGGFVVEATQQSGSAVADQTIDFELDHATETGDLESAYSYGWSCRIVYPGVDPLTQWDNVDPISGKVKVLEDRVGDAAP